MKDVPVADARSLSGILKTLGPSGLLNEPTLKMAVSQFQESASPDAASSGIEFGRFLVSQGLITEWHLRNLLEGKGKGFFLGKYKLLRPIGSGGMSHVYLAEHTRMHRQVAIKVLTDKLTRDPNSLERFLIEARAIAALDHANIIRAFSVDSDGSRYYLVMQYVDGNDLERTVEVQGKLAPERAVDYISQAADGLAHAHEQGMVHRDVKPANLLVDKTGIVKILDLGLALRVEASHSLTQAGGNGVMLGTTDFLAPEQAMDSHNVDARTDIYALGCTLYYLLAGHAPFPEGSMAERLMKHQTVEAPRLNRLRADVPANLAGICAKMMAKHPDERYQTANEVRAVLLNWLASHSRSPGEVGSSFAVPQVSSGRGDIRKESPLPKAKAPSASSITPMQVLVDEDEDSSPSSPRHVPAVTDTRTWGGPAQRPRSGLSPVVLSAIVAGAVLVLGLIGWGVTALLRKPVAPAAGAIVLDWPSSERVGGKIQLDGAEVALPAAGAIEIPAQAGARHLVLSRPGFPPYERSITVEPGQRRNVSAWWGGTGDAPTNKAVALKTPVTTKATVPPVPPADGGKGGTVVARVVPPVTQPTGPAIDPVFVPRPHTPATTVGKPLAPLKGAGGVVSHIKVLSDKTPDVSSLDAWRRAYVTESQSPGEKALSVWRSVCQFQHFDHPPPEYLHHEALVHDPIKIFNVYGYSSPSSSAASMVALARSVGLAARGRVAVAHAVSEVEYEGAWHLLDAGYIATYPKPDGQLASMDELIATVKDWHAANPGYDQNDVKLREFMRAGGWRKGPDLLARSEAFDEQGWMPAANFGWNSIMQKFDGRESAHYEYGYSMGYQVNVQLRPGERLVRNWSNQGLHVGSRGGGLPTCLKQPVGQGALRYTPAMGDLAPGRIGNGRHEYTVGLATKALRNTALVCENLSTRDERSSGPALALADAAQAGTLVLRMPTSYVYLSGQVKLSALIPTGGSIAVSYSENHGLEWKPVAMLSKSDDYTLDLTDLCFRRYDYRLKFAFTGEGTGLDKLEILHDVQHSQRPLPALAEGKNQIAFSAGPAEGTITLEGSTLAGHRDKQLVYTDFNPTLQNAAQPHINIPWGEGSITFPVETPGDLVRLRFGTHYRARDASEGWDYEVSYDNGRTFRRVDRAAGPTAGFCRYTETAEVPVRVRKALVRFTGVTRNTTMILNFRIDADYAEPHGGFQPVKVTYAWEEAGQAKTDVHVARTPDELWEIECAARPLMKSLTVELAE